tara:strand:+ start:662 stop:922 length:261 start_codon:yes stop_codon:yes gene_type:complete
MNDKELGEWITEHEGDIHATIYKHKNDLMMLGKILRRIKKNGTPKQYTVAFDYAKSITPSKGSEEWKQMQEDFEIDLEERMRQIHA